MRCVCTRVPVAGLEAGDTRVTTYVRPVDRLGDNDVISVGMVDWETWRIDTWLMSCRGRGRRMGEAVFDRIACATPVGDATALASRYIPLADNKMVAYFSARLSFAAAREAAGETLRQLDVATHIPPDLPMHLELQRD